MKIRSLISLAMAASLITACSNEEELTSTTTEGMLRATMEESHPATRVGFDTQGKFFWSQNDALGVTTSSAPTTFTKFTLQEGCGQASGAFSGKYSGKIEGYAVYPYNTNHSMNGTTLTYNFPTNYTYSQVDTDYFTTEQGKGNSFNPAMWGSINNGSVALKHLGGVFCIKIEKMPLTAGKLIFFADKKITGNFEVDLAAATPILSSQDGGIPDNAVTISFSGATENGQGVFYVPVPTGTYNVTIKMTNESDVEDFSIPAGAFTIKARYLQKLEVKDGNIDASEQQKVEDLNSAATELKNSDAVSVTGEIAGTSNTVTIPSDARSASKSLSLENVANGASLKIEGNDGSTTTPVTDFTLSIPNNQSETETDLLDVELNMPNATVTLAGNAGVATYGNVTAETADNTLIISSGVEVQKVIVKKGNIRVNKGAKLVAIEKSSDNQATTVTVYKEDGAEIPSSLDEKFVVVDAAVADMQKVFAEGGTYTLPKNMNIVGVQMMVPKGKEVTLDLNGKTLEAANDGLIRVEGSFILQDNAGYGVIKATKDYGRPYTTGIIYVDGEDAKMTMKSGNIYAVRDNPPNNGQFGIGLWRGADLTIEGGKIEAGWYAVSGNGQNTTQNSVINITGGELISAADYAVYLPQAGTTTISGGTIKGACGAIGMRSGTLNINDQAKLIGEGTGDSGQWGDGTGTMGYAVINIGTGNQNTYGDCTVNITGGTFIAEGKSVGIAKREDGAKHNIAVSVTGGTFSDLSATDYIAEDGNVNIELNKDIILTKQIITKGTMTLNLNGKTLSNTTNIWNEETKTWSLISVQGKELTIKGDGKLAALKDDCYALDVRNNATLNIEGGEYVGNMHTVYVWEGVANIKGGEYSIQQLADGNKPYEFVLNCYDQHYKADPKKANVIVTGGTFHKFNPASNGAEGELNSTNFCPEGYTATTSDNGETYVVSSTNNR